MKRRWVVVTIGATALLASCAQPGYDQAQLQRKLVRSGVTQSQAKCITDGLDNAFPDPNELVARSAPNAQQERTTAAIIKKCGVTPVSSAPR